MDSFKDNRLAFLVPLRQACLGCLTTLFSVVLATGAAATERTPPPRPGPARIVSLTPSVTETLFALGAGDKVIAVSDACDVPAEVASLPRVGTFVAPVAERVLSLAPDVVITSPTPGNRSAVEVLERAGVHVVVVPEGSSSIAETRHAILAVARAIGAEDAGRRLVAEVDTRLAAVAARVEGRRRPRAVVVVGFEPFVLAGPESYLGELLEVAGGANAAAAIGGKWPRTGWEYLVSARIEVIIDLVSAMGGSHAGGNARWQRFAEIPAVASQRVHVLGGSALLRPGPRLGEAAEAIARALHPEAWTKAP